MVVVGVVQGYCYWLGEIAGEGGGEWGVMSGLAIVLCVLAGGKRVIVCVGSWQACKMPGMRMCWRRLWWR